MYKEHCFLSGKISIGHGNRIAGYITAPYVEKPHEIIQFRQDETIGVLLFHLFHDIFQFLFKTSARNGLFYQEYPACGELGSVCPDVVRQVFLIGKPDFFFCQRILIGLSFFGGKHPPIKAKGLSLFHFPAQKFSDCGNTFLLHAE